MDNIEEKLQQELCTRALERSLKNGRLDSYLYGAAIPKIRTRFSTKSQIDYYGMLEAIYRKHLECPELNLPNKVEEGLMHGLVLTKEEAKDRYYSNLLGIFNVLNAHLVEQAEGKATFDISEEVYKLARKTILDHRLELKDYRMWEEIQKTSQVTRERHHKSVI